MSPSRSRSRSPSRGRDAGPRRKTQTQTRGRERGKTEGGRPSSRSCTALPSSGTRTGVVPFAMPITTPTRARTRTHTTRSISKSTRRDVPSIRSIRSTYKHTSSTKTSADPHATTTIPRAAPRPRKGRSAGSARGLLQWRDQSYGQGWGQGMHRSEADQAEGGKGGVEGGCDPIIPAVPCSVKYDSAGFVLSIYLSMYLLTYCIVRYCLGIPIQYIGEPKPKKSVCYAVLCYAV